jgi:hypothetical protein
MLKTPTVTYYGWSALSIDTDAGSLFFDPFFRKYCNAKWFDKQDFSHAKYICVTHGHEEHFLDVPVIAKEFGSTVVGPDALVKFLAKRNKIAAEQLIGLNSGESRAVPGFTVSAFDWKHRDINLVKALSKAVFRGNTTQLAWAWSSATNAPFYSPYTGYHVELPNGMTVLNYNEGFNSKMTDGEIAELGKRFQTDVLLAGMQLDFVDDVVRGAKALAPKVVVLYPPHEAFHAMMGVTSRPWSEFHDAVARALPQATVVLANPGDRIDMTSGRVTGNLLTLANAA